MGLDCCKAYLYLYLILMDHSKSVGSRADQNDKTQP